jgi:hypothetical protein
MGSWVGREKGSMVVAVGAAGLGRTFVIFSQICGVHGSLFQEGGVREIVL